MTRITNAEQVMALVRNQLQRMAKRERSGSTQKTRRNEAKTLTQQERISALNAIDDLSEEDFIQSFVRALLSEELGAKASYSPEFQTIVERTAKAMQSDDATLMLFRELRNDLKGQASSRT